MDFKTTPKLFELLQSKNIIDELDIQKTDDGFWLIYKSVSDILAQKNIFEFSDSDGNLFKCNRFFNDWFLYAVPNGREYTYSLLKMREQEFDLKEDDPSDGDTPGVTISFIALNYKTLLDCLDNPSYDNSFKLNNEINRVVVYKRQLHDKSLKKYFKNPASNGSYLVANLYTSHIANMAPDGFLKVPEYYKEIVHKSISYKNSNKFARLPQFIESLNHAAGYIVCDNEKIYIKNSKNLTEYETAAILATHTGNTSIYSFAAEVEYHARFLVSFLKIKIPFFRKSIYESAIRADMTICDNEFEGPAPFYRSNSKIVKRQCMLHQRKV